MRRERTMKQRQTHSKSRRGCLNCKKRHVKCDEQGPPCANCVVRKTVCSYSKSPIGSSARLETPTYLDPSSALPVGLASETSLSSGSSSLSPPRASRMPSPSETSLSSSSEPQLSAEPRRLLELELMHRWSTNTYLAMTSHPEEYPLMQNIMPREALQHDFILYIMFALTSLDLAVNMAPTEADASSYIRNALDYHSSASSGLNIQLHARVANPQDNWLMYVAATAHTACHLALYSTTRAGTAMSHTISIFDIWSQAMKLGISDFDALLTSPAAALQSMLRIPTTLESCDANARATIARLHDVNDALHDPAAYPEEVRPVRPIGPALDAEPLSKHEMYRRAVFHLGTCFAEDATGMLPAYCASFPSLPGERFAAAVGAGEPMALLIIMHWGVLLHRMGLRCWWATGVGACLVEELSESLPKTDVALLQGGQEGMAWARGEVGLAVWGSWDSTIGADLGLS